MSGYPTDLRYTDKHHWVRARETFATVGLTEFASERLGAVGFVELPYAGELIRAGEQLARMRSEAGMAPLTMPILGQIKAVNDALNEAPGLINSDPYGEGWIVRIEPGDPAAVDGLMDAAGYEAFLAAQPDA